MAACAAKSTDGAERLLPVSIVTGFLGSGKTTLISRALRDPAFGRTAVVVNEFGDIGLDHDLIASSDDSVLTLNTGCLCCAVQTDLAKTLMELLQRREAGVANYDRVLIETSGLSDPAPMLQSMMTDNGISATHQLPYVITLVDTIHGDATLRNHIEARYQVALADRVLISKTDLRPASDALIAALDALNPGALRMTTTEAKPTVFFGQPAIEAITERLARTPRRPGHAEIDTFTVERARPLPALALTMLLQAIAEHCGPRLLRLKGLVGIQELPGRPGVIHGVRHTVSPPEFLERWPSADERTRIVFITKGVPRYFVSRLLDAIEEEVRDAIIRQRPADPTAGRRDNESS
jgi:G3E family GTPase